MEKNPPLHMRVLNTKKQLVGQRSSWPLLPSLQISHPPPSRERANNLPVQAPRFTGGKTRTQTGKWLGQGRTALAGQLALEYVVADLTGGPVLPTPTRSRCPADSPTAQCGNQCRQSRRSRGVAPKARSQDSSPPKDIKQKGRLDQKAKAAPKCRRCRKLSRQTCQTCSNYPAC